MHTARSNLCVRLGFKAANSEIVLCTSVLLFGGLSKPFDRFSIVLRHVVEVLINRGFVRGVKALSGPHGFILPE